MAASGADGLAWQKSPFGRELPLAPRGGRAGFLRLPASAIGISWTNFCSASRAAGRQNLQNGSGLALGDYDGDGWCDLYFCNREGPNALYRNLGGWRFVDVTATTGVATTNLVSSGALFADLDGDGRLDLHVTSFLGPDALFLNRGDGTFTNATAQAGVSTAGGATSSAAADLDGDGDLDLYVCRFAVEALLRDGSLISTRMVNGQPVVTGRAGRRLRILNGKLYEHGEPDLLFLNQGEGRFLPASWSERFVDDQGRPLSEAPPDLGFAVQLRDIDGDGFPDVYVCNDFQTPDRIWLNDGKGHFRPPDPLRFRNMSYASMGVDFADLDRDGFLDYYTVEMLPFDHTRHLTHVVRGADPELRQPRNPFVRDAFARSVLGHNRGDGTYAEIAWYAHTATSDWAWTPIFLDVDLDGFEDLIISGGYAQDVNHLDYAGGAGRGEGRRVGSATDRRPSAFPSLDLPVQAFRNRGDLTFEDHLAEWGFGDRFVMPAMALADLDNDGDLDAVGNVFNGPPVLYRNDGAAPRIAVRLVGTAPNTGGTGARVRLLGGTVKVQEQEMLAGGRYLAADQGQRTFAAAGPGPFTLEIRWRNGRITTCEASPNHLYEIHEASNSASAPPGPAPAPAPSPTPWFTQIPLPGDFFHQDPPSDELARQPLLPWRQGFQGPGLAWWDIDHDGREELILGNGREGHLLSVGFEPGSLRATSVTRASGPPLVDDAHGLLGITLKPGRRAFLAALSSYESGATSAPTVLTFSTTQGSRELRPGPSLAGGPVSSGPMAAGDLDGDGDLDLVVGGRPTAGRYPDSAGSRAFRNDDGQLVDDPKTSAVLRDAGIVTGVLVTDLDGDGRPEIILACEWGPIRIFSRAGTAWSERTAQLGLDRQRGLWQCVEAGDFDGDGRLDLVAGNWGLNTHYQRAPAGPWSLVFGDFDGDGRVSMIEAYFEPRLKHVAPMRSRDTLTPELPWLAAIFPQHADFAQASLAAVLGEHRAQTTVWEAETLASTLWLNRGSRFEPLALPREAQWTPVSSLTVADFDGDGDEDLFAAQNFFDVRDEDDRFDAGRGLLLLNDGRGRLASASGITSGILIPGEQRGTAAADIDGDGRMDLAVAVNSGRVVLLQNHHAQPGLRLRIEGPAENPDGIGTQLRIVEDEGSGPLREVRAGAGRFSQASAWQILGGPLGRPRALWVRFPGLEPQTYPLEAGAKEVVVAPTRGLHRVR